MLDFRPYNQNQMLLCPHRVDEHISENAHIRIVSALIDTLMVRAHQTLVATRMKPSAKRYKGYRSRKADF